jgi:hypothetical protein
MVVTNDQLRDALGLVDEMIDCNAQLHEDMDAQRRQSLEAAIAIRAATVRALIDTSEGP